MLYVLCIGLCAMVCFALLCPALCLVLVLIWRFKRGDERYLEYLLLSTTRLVFIFTRSFLSMYVCMYYYISIHFIFF